VWHAQCGRADNGVDRIPLDPEIIAAKAPNRLKV